MAEAVTSALGSILLGSLNTLVLEELGLVFGLQTEFEKLKRTFMTVQAVLKDAEEKQWKDKDIRIWLQDLKDAAYDADDVLGEFSIEAQRRRQRRGLNNGLRSFSFLDLVSRFKMAHKLKNVREKFDATGMEKNKFKQEIDLKQPMKMTTALKKVIWLESPPSNDMKMTPTSSPKRRHLILNYISRSLIRVIPGSTALQNSPD